MNPNCPCAGGGTVLTFNVGTHTWSGSGTVGSCGITFNMTVYCGTESQLALGWRLDVTWSGPGCSGSQNQKEPIAATASCNPLYLDFTVITNCLISAGCGIVHVIVTT